MNPDEQRWAATAAAARELSQEQREVYDMIVGGPRAGARRVSPLTDEAGRLEGAVQRQAVQPAARDCAPGGRGRGPLCDRIIRS